MILFINTSRSNEITIAVINKKTGKANEKKVKIIRQQEGSRKLLPAINDLLDKNKIKVSSLSGIIVVSGPGGFASLRIGISYANAFGYGLNIPVVGITLDKVIDYIKMSNIIKSKKFLRPAVPAYGREPNVLFSQKKTMRVCLNSR